MHRFTHAILRIPAPSFAEGLTTVSSAEAPSHSLMAAQHAAYAEALRAAGLQLTILDPLPAFPDAHFVEDVAVVVPELAVVTRPGAPSRAGEVEHIVAALSAHRPVAQLEDPATLDGGDVLIIGRDVLVGISTRTNLAGVAGLGALLGPHGYRVRGVPVPGGLHLKSSVNVLDDGLLVATPAFASLPELADYEVLELVEGEELAANALRVNDVVLVTSSVPSFAQRLPARGLEVVEIDMSEVEKMDGGLTCLSLRL